MRSRSCFWLLAILSSALLFPSAAIADTIRITTGFVEFGGALDIGNEERGLRLLGTYGGGTPGLHVFCECSPGDVALFAHAFGGLDSGVGTVMLDGVTYNEVSSLNSTASAEIGFSSSHLLPPFSSSTAVLHDPFRMQGSFSHPGGVELLFGSGIVTTRWSPESSGESRGWSLASARYDFSQAEPVPEPGTMALVGVGGAAALLRRRKQRAATSSTR
jgi:hypothetical protein